MSNKPRCKVCKHPRGTRRLGLRAEQPQFHRNVIGTVKKKSCSCECHG